jgi:hypothetical protein
VVPPPRPSQMEAPGMPEAAPAEEEDPAKALEDLFKPAQ